MIIIPHEWIVLFEVVRVACDIIECFHILRLIDPIHWVHLLSVINPPESLNIFSRNHQGASLCPQPAALVIAIVTVTEFLEDLINRMIATEQASSIMTRTILVLGWTELLLPHHIRYHLLLSRAYHYWLDLHFLHGIL